jgi:hypothetical protein
MRYAVQFDRKTLERIPDYIMKDDGTIETHLWKEVEDGDLCIVCEPHLLRVYVATEEEAIAVHFVREGVGSANDATLCVAEADNIMLVKDKEA